MTLRAALAAAVGADGIIEDGDRLAILGHDVYAVGGVPMFAVRPSSIAALQAAVRACASAGVAIVPRGGGASYSDAYLHAPGGHVLFDLGGLDSIDVDLANAVVTVGPGVTWAALKADLARHGVRTPFWGPFSGLFATVGGSVSQNAVSHGSGAHGISAQSVISMDVVLASGEVLRTAPSTATRHTGPDLTGLFTGDCGALGIKAAIRLPLLAVRDRFEALSFVFDAFPAFALAMRDAAHEALDDDHFGVDRALSQGQIGKAGGASKFAAARAVMATAPNLTAGARQLAAMALAGNRALTNGEFMAHFIVEGVDAAEVSAKARRLRQLMTAHGREIANTVPGFVRALPFAPFTNILGPAGERWVPLHGILPHAAVTGFHTALSDFYADRRAEMKRLGVWEGAMFSSIGSTGFLYEIALYWPDAQTPYHIAMLDPAFLANLPTHPANPEARAFVGALKRDLIALYAAHGAVHFQLGRAYPYTSRLDPAALALVRALKAQLDPRGLMNPGVLGL